MEENSILANDEVLGETEVIAARGSGKGIMIAAGIGLSVLAGVIVYKYVVKPMVAKIKEKKEPRTEIPSYDTTSEELDDSV